MLHFGLSRINGITATEVIGAEMERNHIRRPLTCEDGLYGSLLETRVELIQCGAAMTFVVQKTCRLQNLGIDITIFTGVTAAVICLTRRIKRGADVIHAIACLIQELVERQAITTRHVPVRTAAFVVFHQTGGNRVTNRPNGQCVIHQAPVIAILNNFGTFGEAFHLHL